MHAPFNISSLHRGQFTAPTERSAENCNALVGSTFGGPGSPLHDTIQAVNSGPMGRHVGCTSGYDQNDNSASETFMLGGRAAQTLDDVRFYNAALTYANGSKAPTTESILRTSAAVCNSVGGV